MLPSGRVVRFTPSALNHARPSTDPKGSCLHVLSLVQTPGFVTTDAKDPVDISSFPLRDFHVLRAFLGYAGIVPDEPITLPCENCDKPFQVKASSLFEVGPFIDQELHDPELDAPFDYAKTHPIPRILVGRTHARNVRLAERQVQDVLSLWQAENTEEFQINPAIVTAMGLVALGRERRATVIAEALMRASPDTFRALMDLVYQAHYSPRLVGAHTCVSCGARNDVEVLPIREIPDDARAGRTRKSRHFPDVETFERLVREAGKRIYRQRGVRNIALIVDDGVAEVDDGGERLLGCYTPSNVDELTGHDRGPEIRLFYRTFQAAFQDEPTFDVRAEIDETIDHEVVHHLHFLAGDDPLDDEEREAIVEENVRRIGKRESARRAGKLFVDDVTGFFRTAWPLLLVAFVATWLGFFRCR
jgi:hypothetical protein